MGCAGPFLLCMILGRHGLFLGSAKYGLFGRWAQLETIGFGSSARGIDTYWDVRAGLQMGWVVLCMD
jgi:hypothetical protein